MEGDALVSLKLTCFSVFFDSIRIEELGHDVLSIDTVGDGAGAYDSDAVDQFVCFGR